LNVEFVSENRLLDETGLRSCPVAGCVINGIESLSSATSVLAKLYI